MLLEMLTTEINIAQNMIKPQSDIYNRTMEKENNNKKQEFICTENQEMF